MPRTTKTTKSRSDLIADARRSCTECDAARAAIDAEMTKPAPMLGLHPLAQRLARRHDPNEEIDMETGFLRCSTCEALTPIACQCERPLYVKAGAKFVTRKGFEPRTAVTKSVTRSKPGPKPAGGKAMTAAERKRRQRAKHRKFEGRGL